MLYQWDIEVQYTKKIFRKVLLLLKVYKKILKLYNIDTR